MKDIIRLVLGILLLAGAASAQDISAGGSLHLAVGTHFGASPSQVAQVRSQIASDDELAVPFFIARQAGVQVGAVLDARSGGKDWEGVSRQFGVQPDSFYVPVKGKVSGPPYGKAYGYWKNKKKGKGKGPKLDDADVSNMVNLQVLSKHYGMPPEEVIQMRSQGKGFGDISSLQEAKGRGKGKGKGKENAPGWSGQEDGGQGNPGGGPPPGRGRGKGK